MDEFLVKMIKIAHKIKIGGLMKDVELEPMVMVMGDITRNVRPTTSALLPTITNSNVT